MIHTGLMPIDDSELETLLKSRLELAARSASFDRLGVDMVRRDLNRASELLSEIERRMGSQK